MEGEYRKSPKKTPSVTNTKSLNKIKRKKKEKSSLTYQNYHLCHKLLSPKVQKKMFNQ